MAKKLPVLVFLVVLLVYTLYPGVEAVRQASVNTVPVQSEATSPASADEYDTIDFGDQTNADAQPDDAFSAPTPEPAGAGDVVVRYPDTPDLPEATPAPIVTPMPTPEATPVAKGMSGPDVSELQQKLVVLGFMEDKPDGVYGSGTEDAVKALQEYLSALATGSAPAATVTFQDETTYGDGVVEALSGDAQTTPEPTPEPTPTPAPAFPATGIVDASLIKALDEGFPVYRETIMAGSTGLDSHRVQRRLESMNYLYKGADGVFGDKTAQGLAYFQKINGIPQTGIADKVTQELLFSENAQESDRPYHPYFIKVDLSEQRLYVYTWSNGGYKKLLKKVKCSSGLPKTPTPRGTYQDSTGPGNRWHYFKKFGCWAQYAFYIQGDVMIHSVIFPKKGGRPTTGSVHSLGKKASHGCVRVSVKDAKWIWENCEVGTTVVVQK